MGWIQHVGFNETEFQTALVAGYLSLYVDRLGYRFHMPTRFEERNLGYDFELRTYVPLMLQFKTCTYYHYNTTSGLKQARASRGYTVTKGFYKFNLHKDRKTEQNLQHNMLFQQAGLSFYAAPLFYGKRRLYSRIRRWIRCSVGLPFQYIFHGHQISSSRTYFLPDVIYIKPHKKINDNYLHCYTYSANKEVAFHTECEKVNKNNVFLFSDIFRFTVIDHIGQSIVLNKYSDKLQGRIKEYYAKNGLPFPKHTYSAFCRYFDIRKKEIVKFDDMKEYFTEQRPILPFMFIAYLLKCEFRINIYLIGVRGKDEKGYIENQ